MVAFLPETHLKPLYIPGGGHCTKLKPISKGKALIETLERIDRLFIVSILSILSPFYSVNILPFL